ncbi:hypothetical protein EV126DRAFT_508771 [Verticillium dahliae]|uniref:Uncharacterized protein n=1 Tax=Verticillium longisporum TaxID=100787 RepID=A0A0G4N187_VERLO|nr:hypothetical protein VdG2_03956 [Verticillium dahliae VDG2]KAF3356357.1 hypothetical protein VdG1_06451 [Verticillium dahliae VDG1]KAH6676213.1 hypothetical protein EV126DRAFT_508771 [Verticillium dahliae]CRK40217.1 hypothetical protein BN1708_008149 [Verticillium longisporum]
MDERDIDSNRRRSFGRGGAGNIPDFDMSRELLQREVTGPMQRGWNLAEEKQYSEFQVERQR